MLGRLNQQDDLNSLDFNNKEMSCDKCGSIVRRDSRFDISLPADVIILFHSVSGLGKNTCPNYQWRYIKGRICPVVRLSQTKTRFNKVSL